MDEGVFGAARHITVLGAVPFVVVFGASPRVEDVLRYLRGQRRVAWPRRSPRVRPREGRVNPEGRIKPVLTDPPAG